MRHKTALNLIPRLVMEIVLELCLCVCVFFLFLFLRKQCLELDSIPIEAKGPVSKSLANLIKTFNNSALWRMVKTIQLFSMIMIRENIKLQIRSFHSSGYHNFFFANANMS